MPLYRKIKIVINFLVKIINHREHSFECLERELYSMLFGDLNGKEI